MKPVDYVVAILDADPQGWEMVGAHNLGHTKANLWIWIANSDYGLEVTGDIRLSPRDLGFWGRRKLWKAVKRQQSSALAQKLLDTCEAL